MMADPGNVQVQMQGVGPPMQVQGLPPALGFLSGLSEVNIHQHLDILEVAIGWEKNNKYRLCNSQDQQFMYAKEDTDCCVRQMCGPSRPFTMNITDNNEQPVIQLYRPFRCQASLMWCCYLQEMDIMSPPGLSVGGIRQLWTPWKPKFEVHDAQNTPLYHILGECCFCCPCTDIIFKIVDAQKGNEVGEIVKHWGGCREICGAVNDFKVSFPADLDIMKKVMLLGATFLIDFNYFERNKN